MRHGRLFTRIMSIGLVLASIAPVAAQADEVTTPGVFGGRLHCLVEDDTNGLLPGQEPWRERIAGMEFEMVEMSDQRLAGAASLEWTRQDIPTEPPGGFVATGRLRIDGPDGAWEGPFLEVGLPGDAPSLRRSPNAIALAGEGAYEGLTAITETYDTLLGCGWQVRGLIVEGNVPPDGTP